MLTSLNEYCLVRICDFLDMEDQIALSRVCEFFRNFFEQNFWTWKCKKISLTDSIWKKEENEAYLPILIRIAAKCVEEFTFGENLFEKHEDLLISLIFPKMKKCDAILSMFDDKEVPSMARCFPNIKELRIKGYLNEYISLFKDLETLFIAVVPGNITSFDFHKLPKLKKISFLNTRDYIVRALIKPTKFCTTLEEVDFESFSGQKHIIKNLKNIKNLRKIKLLGSGYYTEVFSNISMIEKYFGNAIDTLVFCGISFPSNLEESLLEPHYLRCIVYYKDHKFDDMFLKLCTLFPYSLEEFYYLDCSPNICKLKDEEEACKLFPLLSQCHNLRLLDVSGCNITKKFIADFVEEFTSREYQQPFLLRCFQTKITQQHLQDLALPANFQVSLLKHENFSNTLSEKYFEVQLDRAKITNTEKEEDQSEDEEWDDDYGYNDYDDYGPYNSDDS